MTQCPGASRRRQWARWGWPLQGDKDPALLERELQQEEKHMGLCYLRHHARENAARDGMLQLSGLCSFSL